MHDQLISFIEREVEAEEHDVRLSHRSNVAFRVKNGQCITDLRFKGVSEDGLFIYGYADNQSKFRAGDLLVINPGKPRGDEVLSNGILVWLNEIDHVEKIIKVEPDQQIEPPPVNKCTADKGFYDYNSERLKHSIALAYEDDNLAAFLEGRAKLRSCTEIGSGAIEHFWQRYSRLTKRQAQALACSMSHSKTLIQGPPGSGKTFLLALIIRHSLSLGRSVLITAPTHKAIDNLMLAAVKSLEEEQEEESYASGKVDLKTVQAIKIVGKGKVQNLHKRIMQTTTADTRLSELTSPYLIGATIYQAYKFLQNDKLAFDLVVIDEASQMPLAHAVPAFLNSSRYVIAGDHRQLPPVFKSSFHPPELKKSMFEQLHSYYSEATITLDTTFRMNSSINEFPSRAFYSNLLRSSDCAKDRSFAVVRSAKDELSYLTGKSGSITFIELDHTGAIQKAAVEADLVARLAFSLLANQNLRHESLAIVSPHRAHNEVIRSKLLHYAETADLESMAKRILIDTVERLQGQEREVIIFSLCASDRQYAINRASFLYSPNRLNVAITRCRTKLFIVGSKYFFPHISGIIVDPNLLKLWRDYYDYLDSSGFRIVPT
jgi:DNA replication ATP-dependent helicase Dna2